MWALKKRPGLKRRTEGGMPHEGSGRKRHGYLEPFIEESLGYMGAVLNNRQEYGLSLKQSLDD